LEINLRQKQFENQIVPKAHWKLACGATTGICAVFDLHSERVLLTIEFPPHFQRGNR